MADAFTPGAAPEQMQVPVDESHIVAHYANFCRVTGTPEELIVDFGLNKQVAGNSPETIQLTQRIIVNFFTAKRLAYALGMAVQRHARNRRPEAGGAAADRQGLARLHGRRRQGRRPLRHA
jgi:hypothetical protein